MSKQYTMNESHLTDAVQKAHGITKEEIGKLYVESSGVFDDEQSRAYIRVFPKNQIVDSLEAAFVTDQLVEHYMAIDAYDSSGSFYANLQGHPVQTINASEPSPFRPHIKPLSDYPSVTPKMLADTVRIITGEDVHLTYKGKSVTAITLDEVTSSVVAAQEWWDYKVIFETGEDYMVLCWYTLA